MVHAFILMYFTWVNGEGDHMFAKYPSNSCCTIDKSMVKEVYIKGTPLLKHQESSASCP